MPQTISLCMITKDEGNNLSNCLDSARDIVDEIIILDTGSTDNTKEIAIKFNAKVLDFKWQDDFSAARNESIKHATKEWILVLDADETIDSEGKKEIKEIINKGENDAFLFLQKNYTNETSIAGFVNEEHKHNDKIYSGWYGSFIARLFRNRKNYKFDGIVHELVEPSIEKSKGKIAATEIVLHHYGNSNPEIARKKRQIYLELCKRKAEQKQDAATYYELGVLHKENNNFDDAIISFKKAIQLNPKHGNSYYEIGVINEQQKNLDDAIENYIESLKIKENSEALQNLGVCYLKKGMLKEAYESLMKAMLLNANKYTIYNNLGAVLERLENYDSAVQMLQVGIRLNPKNTIGFYNLGIVLDKKGDFANAVKAFEQAVQLGHRNSEEIKKRINQLKALIKDTPNYSYGFKVGE